MNEPSAHTRPPATPDARGEASTAHGERAAAFRPGELAVVLAQYDLGVVRSVRPFQRGARAAPKALVEADRGRFLLKRRRPGEDNPFRVAAVHTLQLHLRGRGFPLPRLVGTKRAHNSLLQLDGAVYELFEFIEGGPYDAGATATRDAGRWLAAFHRMAPEAHMPWRPPTGGYHASRRVRATLRAAATRLGVRRGATAEALATLYERAADRVERLGARRWRVQLIHGDWHAGNMLFGADGRVTGVLDYDAVRQAPRALDVAQGLAQFSIVAPGRGATEGGTGSDGTWPAALDEDRLAWFWAGYRAEAREGGRRMTLGRGERRALPWLMVEALIAEAVEPVARTGQFLRADGASFLRMIGEKSAWIAERAGGKLARLLR